MRLAGPSRRGYVIGNPTERCSDETCPTSQADGRRDGTTEDERIISDETTTYCILASMLLTACGERAHPTVMDGDTGIETGELIHESGWGSRLVLQTATQRYEARGFSI